jgi:hypothetical protein
MRNIDERSAPPAPRRLAVDVKSPHDGFDLDGRHFDHIANALRSGLSCAVIEIAFCDPKRCAAFEEEIRDAVPGVSVQYIYFEKDLKRANENCRRRNDERDLEALYDLNEQLAAVYTIPPGADVRPITLRPE